MIYTETGMRYEITDDIFLNVQINWETDSKPAAGTSADDTTFVVGAGIVQRCPNYFGGEQSISHAARHWQTVRLCQDTALNIACR